MNHSKYKVFLVDDDEEDLAILTEAFTIADCTSNIEWFTSPPLLLNHLTLLTQKELPDIIIMDHEMPLMDGSDMLQFLRTEKNLQNTTLAIYSTNLQQKNVEGLLSNGLDFFLTKGNSIVDIQEHVKMFCAAIVQKQLFNDLV